MTVGGKWPGLSGIVAAIEKKNGLFAIPTMKDQFDPEEEKEQQDPGEIDPLNKAVGLSPRNSPLYKVSFPEELLSQDPLGIAFWTLVS